MTVLPICSCDHLTYINVSSLQQPHEIHTRLIDETKYGEAYAEINERTGIWTQTGGSRVCSFAITLKFSWKESWLITNAHIRREHFLKEWILSSNIRRRWYREKLSVQDTSFSLSSHGAKCTKKQPHVGWSLVSLVDSMWEPEATVRGEPRVFPSVMLSVKN